MVRAGFLDVKIALDVITEQTYNGISCFNEPIREHKAGHLKEIWDWELDSSVREVKEGMEKSSSLVESKAR